MNTLATRIAITAVVIFHIILACFYSLNQNLNVNSEGYFMLSEGVYNHYSKQTLDLTADSLKTVLVSSPMNLWENTIAPVILLVLLRLLAFFIIFKELAKLFSPSTMIWFSVLFLLSPWLMYSTALGADAYIQLGVAGYLVSVLKLTRSNQPRSSTFLWTVLLAFSILWCLALSPAWGVLLITTVILWIKKTIHPNVSGLITSLAVIAVIMIPYVHQLEINEDSEIYVNHSYNYWGFGTVYVYPLFKGLIYWIRYGSAMFQSEIVYKTGFSWLSDSETVQSYCSYAWRSILIIAGLLSVIISLMANCLMIKEIKPLFFRNFSEDRQLSYLKIICTVMLASIVLFIAVSPYTLYSNTLSLCYVFALIPLLNLIEKFNSFDFRKHVPYIAVLAVFFIIVNGLALMESKDYSNENNYMDRSNDIVSESFN